MCKTFYTQKMQENSQLFWQNNPNFPNSKGMGHIPKMVKKALYYNVYSAVSGTFFKVMQNRS
jgi:hypothetical protein